MKHIYSSPRILVLQHKALPAGATRKNYEESGWPRFEQSIASLATEVGGKVYRLDTRSWLPVRQGTRASADEMRAFFHSDATHFYGSADRDVVSNMFAEMRELVERFDEDHMPFFSRLYHECLLGPATKMAFARIIGFLVVIGLFVAGVGLLALSENLHSAGTAYNTRVFGIVALLALLALIFSFILASRVARTYASDVWRRAPPEERQYTCHLSLRAPPFRRAGGRALNDDITPSLRLV